MRKRKIYVASSWKNEMQGAMVTVLRTAGHEVYDFKNPEEGKGGFHWSQVDPNWESWSTEEYRKALEHPLPVEGFKCDMEAMLWADTFVLVLPCGRSAHLELGWAVGKGKETLILLDKMEPELMAKMVDHICISYDDVLKVVGTKYDKETA